MQSLISKRSRETSIDALRGLAIFTMVAANMSAEALAEPHPFWFRVYGSFAAPTFILLTGLMVGHTSIRRGHGLGYYALRGLMVMLMGAILDMSVYQIWPFITCEVLYLIGISMPLVFLFLRLPTTARWTLILIVLAMGPVLQNAVGYAVYPAEYLIAGPTTWGQGPPVPLWHAWLIDGWFPIFPWLGMAFLGGNLAKIRWQGKKTRGFASLKHFATGLFILAIGLAVWKSHPGAMYNRMGFSELFYPPTPGFIITAVGFILSLFSLFDAAGDRLLLRPLAALGGSSLFMYAFHLLINQYIVVRFWPSQPMSRFIGFYLGLVIIMIIIGFSLRALHRNKPTMPFLLRFLLGG